MPPLLEANPELLVPTLRTSHRNSDCSLLDTWHLALHIDCSMFHTNRLALLADCSAFHAERLISRSDCSLLDTYHPALGMDCSTLIAECRSTRGLLRVLRLALAPCMDCSMLDT